MPQDLTLGTSSSEVAMETVAPDATYKEKLKFWAIARILPDAQHHIVARYRTRSDADGYLKFLRQHQPQQNLIVLYAPHS